MEEYNRKKLVEALSSLPVYEPDEKLWSRLCDILDAVPDTPMPRQWIRELPVYKPSESAWEAIAARLKPPQLTLQRRFVRQWAAIAAVVLALVFFWFFQTLLPSQKHSDIVQITSTEMMPDPVLLRRDWDEDEYAFEDFLNLCESKMYICEQPVFKQLKSELEELTAAKRQLTEALGTYGQSPYIIAEIKEIELQRTNLLKKLMVMLI